MTCCGGRSTVAMLRWLSSVVTYTMYCRDCKQVFSGVFASFVFDLYQSVTSLQSLPPRRKLYSLKVPVESRNPQTGAIRKLLRSSARG